MFLKTKPLGYPSPSRMIINKFYLFVFYFFRLILFINYRSPFIFWIFTELNLLIFIVIIYALSRKDYKQEIFDLVLFYFLIQSIASIFLLRDFFFSEDFFIFNSDSIFLASMLMKLGIFPFFYWIYKISNFFNLYPLVLVLTFQKIPFFSFLFRSINSNLIFILLFSFISGSVLIFYSRNFIFLMVSSSIRARFWIFYIYSFSFYFFLIYFLIYSLFLYLLFNNYLIESKIGFNLYFNITLFMFILGLPPLSLFFFKLYLIKFFLLNFGNFEIFVFWFFSFISLFGYIGYRFKRFYSNLDLYLFTTKLDYKIYFFFLSSIFFFLFLI